jgi:putative ABC transport system permease protein
MKDVLFLAWRYLAHNRVKTVVLVGSIMLIIYLPVALRVLVQQSASELTSRAEATPLLVGAKGSPLELALSSLYFESDTPELTTYAEAERVAATGLADPIPLYVRFGVRQQPIVATSLEYFGFRGLRFGKGRAMAMLGECVLGARAAEVLGVGVGDTVISSPESVFDIAGVYPLKMKVVGVLERVYTADDAAVFVDLKTAWIIQGLVHGHQDMAAPESATGVLSREGDKIVANASVIQYTEITDDNIDSFHFHGSTSGFPISAVIAVPHDQKSGTILMGRFEAPDEPAQILEPTTVIDELLGTIFTVQNFVVAGMLLVGLAALATAILVFVLSLRLRKREIETMARIGGSRARVAGVLITEVAVVVVSSVVLAGALTLLTARFAPAAVRLLVLRG